MRYPHHFVFGHVMAWFFIFFSSIVFAQNTTVDSLNERVQSLTGKEQVDALNALSFNYLIIDLAKSYALIQKTKELSQQLNYPLGTAQAEIYEGLYFNLKSDKKKALQLLQKGGEEARKIGHRGWQGYALTQLGNFYRNQGLYDSAKIWYTNSYRVLSDSLYPWHLSVLYRNMGRYYGNIALPKQEFFYLEKARAIREHLPDKVLLADIYVNLSNWHLSQSNLEQALDYLKKAEGVRADASATEIQLDIQYQKAIIYFRQGKYSEGLAYFEEVKSFYLKNSSLKAYTKALIDLGEVLEEIGDYDISLKNYYEALKVAEEKSFLNDEVLALIGISRNFYRLKQSAMANQFVGKALQLAEANRFTSDVARAYNQKGLILKFEKKYDSAILFFEKSLAIRKNTNDKKGTASTLANIGETQEAKGNLKEALRYLLESIQLKEEILHQSGMAWGYYDLGSVYTKLGNYPEAHRYLTLAEKTARLTRHGIVLVNIYETRRNLLGMQGRTREALQFSILFEKLKDSVTNSALSNRILSLQSNYELDKRNQEIRLLQANDQLQQKALENQQEKIDNQRIIILISILGLAVAGVLFYQLFRSSHQTKSLNKQLQEKNEEVTAQSEELSEANNALQKVNTELGERSEEILAQAEELTEANASLTELNKALAEKQEEIQAQSEELRESNEIIRQLNEGLELKVTDRTRQLEQAYKELDTFFYRSSHDFRRPLTTFMGLAEVAKITVKDQNALHLFEKVRETAVNLDRMLIKLQSISDVGAQQFVYKEVSLNLLLEAAFDSFREAIDRKKIRYQVHMQGVQTFYSYPAFLKIIIENLIENAVQFCRPQEAMIDLFVSEKDGGLQFIIKDNGIGIEKEYQDRVFDMFFRGSEQSKGNGLGLYIVKKAVEKLGGQLSFESLPAIGSTFTIWIPHGHQTISFLH
ncbi:MAG: tetratricopeptide repeat protein [Cyclobacteriaceae bacterium]|nr:tetratricopeptide repeat protein [Cyclobacteriaceae bacterium]